MKSAFGVEHGSLVSKGLPSALKGAAKSGVYNDGRYQPGDSYAFRRIRANVHGKRAGARSAGLPNKWDMRQGRQDRTMSRNAISKMTDRRKHELEAGGAAVGIMAARSAKVIKPAYNLYRLSENGGRRATSLAHHMADTGARMADGDKMAWKATKEHPDYKRVAPTVHRWSATMPGVKAIKRADPTKRVNPLGVIFTPGRERAKLDAKIVDRMARSSPKTKTRIYRGQAAGSNFDQTKSPTSWTPKKEWAEKYARMAEQSKRPFSEKLKDPLGERANPGTVHSHAPGVRAWDLRATEATIGSMGRPIGRRIPWAHEEMVVPRARKKA